MRDTQGQRQRAQRGGSKSKNSNSCQTADAKGALRVVEGMGPVSTQTEMLLSRPGQNSFLTL